MVTAEVQLLEHRRELELGGSDLVVARLRRDAEFPELLLDLVHEVEDAHLDRAEVMVLELLVLRGRRAEERTARHHQVGTLQVERLVDKKVLLLGSKRNRDLLVTLAEAMHQTLRRCGERLHRTEERRLLVERLARIGAEGGRDAQGRAVAVALDERGRGRIPRRVAARLEGRADATRREARGIRLADDQVLARERHDRLAILHLEERVVLFGRGAGHREEPMRVMRGTTVHGPLLDRMCNFTSNRGIERLAILNRRLELLRRILREIGLDRFRTKHIGTEIGHLLCFLHHLLVSFFRIRSSHPGDI